MRTFLIAWILALLAGCVSPVPHPVRESSLMLYDGMRQRSVPVELYVPTPSHRCMAARACPVALVSPGYGGSHKGYAFIAEELNRLGYLVVGIQHQLPSDPPLATAGDLFEGRSPVWEQGAANLRFVHHELSRSYPGFDWQHVVLVGHSNGGDIAAWLLRNPPAWAVALVTLDHRRVPLPRGASPRVLSIRAGDFKADPGVLPAPEEQRVSRACIVTLGYARHNDMHDGGGAELKHDITRLVAAFLEGGSCPGAAA